MSQPDEDAETARALSLAHGQVCYLQLPATDGTRAAEFYRDVFGWDIEAYSPDFEAPGLIGQFVEDRPPARDAGPLLWLSVSDMGHALEAVTAHGGQVLEPPAPDGPARTLATIVDPEGNPSGWPATPRRCSAGCPLPAEPQPERSSATRGYSVIL
jgi:uncharacterized protein